jgi:hypothetical protein
MEFRFVPTRLFEWHRTLEDGTKFLVGQYIPGMSYNCSKSPHHDLLREKCREWSERGRIKIYPLNKEEFITIHPGEK